MEYYLPRLRKQIDGKKTYAIVQAEDEIASAGMVVGAGWAGARAMTSTSGPWRLVDERDHRLSLLRRDSFASFLLSNAADHRPVCRRERSKSDISLMYGASHGDTRHIILIPHDMNSCFDFARQSFNYADRFQTPVFVAMDLDLGMNMWSSEPLKLNQEPFDYGKRLRRRTAGRMDESRQKIPPLLRPGRRRHSLSHRARQ